MKTIIFAGGSGKRFWPLSREEFPKQFQPIIDNKSTIELLTEGLAENAAWSDIYFATTERLVSLVKNYFPELPTSNIFTEPVRRDLGPAVALAMLKLKVRGSADEPVSVLWSDSFVRDRANFSRVLQVAEKLVSEGESPFVWLAQKPKFANENIGWIALKEKIGEKNGIEYYKKAGFRYRPSLEDAEKWLDDGDHLWNTGYFVTTPNFILQKIEENNPEAWQLLEKMAVDLGSAKEVETIAKFYPQMPEVHFDNMVLDYLAEDETLVIAGDYDWSDPGTLYALKQFLQTNDEANVVKGAVQSEDTSDSLLLNYEKKKLIATVGLEGMIVVNTPDVLLVCPKDKVGEIKTLLKGFKTADLEKYL